MTGAEQAILEGVRSGSLTIWFAGGTFRTPSGGLFVSALACTRLIEAGLLGVDPTTDRLVATSAT